MSGLRPRPGPQTGAGRALSLWLPPLLVRVRAEWVDRLGMRLEADMGANLPELPDVGFSRVVAVAGEQLLDQRRELVRQRRELQVAATRAQGSHELRSVLQHFLRSTVRDERSLAKDIRALGRSLDVTALTERVDKRIHGCGVELEMLAHVLAHHPLRGPAALLLDSLLDDPRPQTRRAATQTLAGWAVLVLGSGKDRDGALTDLAPAQLERLMGLREHPDVLTGVRALQVLAGLPGPQAQHELRQTLRGEDGVESDFFLRAAAIRLMVEVSPEAARDAYMIARVDPSETVRCALVDALSETATPGARALLQRLRVDDPARSVRTRASRAVRVATPTPDPSPPVQRLRGLRFGQQDTLTLPADMSPLQLAEELLPLTDRDHGFGIEALDARRVRVHRGEQRVLRAWRLLHELRRGDPGKRQYGDHLSGRSMPGEILVPPAGMADVSPTDVPARPVLAEQWGSWGPWLPLPDHCIDALWEGDKTLLTRQGRTRLQPPVGVPARVRAAMALSTRIEHYDQLREQALQGRDAGARRAYTQALEALGFRLDFVPAASGDARLPEMFPPPKQELLLGLAPAAGAALLDSAMDLLSQRSLQPVDLMFLSGGIASVFFGRLVLSHQRTARARARIPLVVGGWGTRGKSGVARLKAAFFEGMGLDVVCKTTGCEAMFLRAFHGRPATEFFLFRPYDRASIWEHADVLQRSADMGAEVFIWECMALRTAYVEQLQLFWTRDDLSTITNTYPDHEDIQGPSGQDVAETISAFMPRGAKAITTEQQMTPILRDRARERDTELVEVDQEEIDTLPADLVARLPYQEHPNNITLVAQLAETLGVDRQEAVVLMADHVVPDLGSLATFPELRLRGRSVEFTNGSSANERTGFLNNWRRCGFEGHDPERDAGDFLVLVVNNRYDRVARSQVFADILVNDAPAHRMVLIGTNLEGLRTYIDTALAQRIANIEIFGGGPELVLARFAALQRQLRIVELPALMRTTAPTLDLDIEAAARAFEDTLETLPARPLSHKEARQLLADQHKHWETLLSGAGGIFTDNGQARSPFHDPHDAQVGRQGAAEVWLELGAEQLRFTALRNAWKATVNDPPAAEDILALEQATGELFAEVFRGRLVVVQDPGASGDQIVERLALRSPLGSRVRVLSSQNIKGTGLDLVYAFFNSRRPMSWALELRATDAGTRSRALEQLQGWHQWSLPLVHELLRQLTLLAQGGGVSELQAALEQERTRRRQALGHQSAGTQGLGPLESLVDPLLSIRRRWAADRIMDDLAHGRISEALAEHELRALTYEQRGEIIEDSPPTGPGLLS